MADDKAQQAPHQTDLEQVAQQVGAVDVTTAASEMLNNTFLGSGARFFGKSNFEGHRLNDMIDMVESANPEHLESAGQALWDARDAINEAAEELSGHIGRVDWEGEAGEAFRDWGAKLVNHAIELATFAETAGTQITAAGTGLASVRNSMPPRDARLNPKTVADIPSPARVEVNDEYTAAVRVEGHRQEAINQMNRLSSFYAVSEQTLAAQSVPVFEPMPGVGVPHPTPSLGEGGETTREAGRASFVALPQSGTAPQHSVENAVSGSRSEGIPSSGKELDGSVTYPARSIGTEIDSVGALPQETVRQASGAPTSVPGSSGAAGGTVPPFTGGSVPPAFGGQAGRTSGFGGSTGSRTPASVQGRAATPGGASRGPTGQVGRASTTGQTGAHGATTAAAKAPMGRSVSGGMPRTGGPAVGRPGGAPSGRVAGAGATGAGRTGGIVGGKPTTGTTPGATGSKVPRGTVVGREGVAGPRTTAGERIVQRGVIGAPTHGTGSGQTPRRSASNPDGVVGAPKGRVSGARNSGPTSGGTGLVRGPQGKQGSDSEEGKGASHRDQSTEGDMCSPRSRRDDVPPATD
ncbi:hypothetical protein ACFYPC_29295 [Streptomyces sp. NPDC005808]|uniref:hypothetical protein n=1 Tax=Streptomyces sp. NPDC005808 TaxID=3364734 RepID=UPI00369BF21A